MFMIVLAFFIYPGICHTRLRRARKMRDRGPPTIAGGPLSFAAGNTYFMFFSYSSIIFLTIWPPTEPASREVRSPL